MAEWVLHVCVAVAGGIGAVGRVLLDRAVMALPLAVRTRLPWGTLVVNLSGALVIGAVAGWISLLPVDGSTPWGPALALGMLGGYTTFSAASHQTVELARRGRWGAALAIGAGQLVAAVVLVGVGWAGVTRLVG